MWGRRAPVVLAGALGVAGAVLLAAVVAINDDDPVQVVTAPATTAAPPATTVPATTTSTRRPTTTRPPTTTTTARPAPTTTAPRPTTTTTAVVYPPGTLGPGASGPEVVALQERLVALGYWLGAVDGVYGASTVHAVVAFQKSVSMGRDGVAGPATLQRLASATRPVARSGGGRVIEVDLERQILLVVAGGQVEWVMDASTGSEPGTTPTGQFAVYYQVDGLDPGPLGVLYRPKYFIRGVAVHGYPKVPPWPASHGCVRVTNPVMDWLWASGAMAMGTPVWVY